MKWRVAFKVGRWVQLEYSFLPPGSLRDEQSVECVGEIRVRQRQESRRRDGVKTDPIFSLSFSSGMVSNERNI